MNFICFLLCFFISVPVFSQALPKVQISPDNKQKKIDVTIDGKLFTSYIFSDSLLNKPILYPLNTFAGQSVVKDFVNKTDGEGPLPSGAWLGYGNVNGINFWRNIDKNKPAKYGKLRHTKTLKIKNGEGAGGLEVGIDWVKEDGTELLYQNNKYIFRSEGNTHSIDIIITLTPITEPVKFADSEEGFFAINLINELSLPQIGSDKIKNNVGQEGIDVIGKKARWVRFVGKVKNNPVTVAIFDHPLNIAFPTYWNISNDGLVTANPLGLKIFTQGRQIANFEIPELNSAIFRYRIVIHSQSAFSDKQINAEYEKFAGMQ